MKHTLSVLVENKPGVLARVASLFARRGFNIYSLSVGPTHQPELSRMTIVVDGTEMEQVVKQLYKLVNVVKISELPAGEALEREIMLVRVADEPKNRGQVLEAAGIFKAKTVDVGPSTITFEAAGTPDKLADFLELLRPYGLVDLVKSGRIALARDQKGRSLQAAG